MSTAVYNIRISQSNSYVFPTVREGDLVIQMSGNEAGLHAGYTAPDSNAILSVTKEIFRFGGNNSNVSISNNQLQVDNINFTGSLTQNGLPFVSGGGDGWTASNTSNLFTYCNVGVGITNPQYPIHVTNSCNGIGIYATGDVVGLSDERLKTNFSVIEDAVSKIKHLTGYTFQYRSDPGSNVRAGLIAQEVLEVFPQVVSQDNMGYYNLAYGNMTALLLNAVKEINDRLEKIENTR